MAGIEDSSEKIIDPVKAEVMAREADPLHEATIRIRKEDWKDEGEGEKLMARAANDAEDLADIKFDLEKRGGYLYPDEIAAIKEILKHSAGGQAHIK